MRSTRTFVVVSIIASLIFLVSRQFASGEWPVFFKVGSIVILALLGARANALLGTALAASALGDLFLGVRQLGSLSGESLFMLGLGAFLVAHVVYILMFRGYGAFKPGRLSASSRVAMAGVALAVLWLLTLLWNSLGALRVPVVVYALVLAAMAITANTAKFENSSPAIGALLFVFSDAVIAINKFRTPFSASGTIIWSSYYLAQLMIFWGVYAEARRSQTLR